ncbi:MAG: ATPase, T2SS/T4P/T4SS family [Peptococcaceae bacterium]|nr:ATPase, T2SS/T4P/T4SS family [Peptococcaceae bacterium]
MDYLQQALELGATDLHIEYNGVAMIRRLGRLEKLGECSSEIFRRLEAFLQAHKDIKPSEVMSIVIKDEKKVKDFSCTIPVVGRLRVRCYTMQGCPAMAIRFLPSVVPEAETLGWPQALFRLCEKRQGLVLVTGATGSGKSTTLAAMIERINKTRACHVLTYEAPIEYRFQNKLAMIHQCEIPEDVTSFLAGAKDALRMDADVIMLGELDCLETMRAAMKLVESGHLVLATMHNGSAAESIGYFINHYPAEERSLVAHQLSTMLLAVVSQRLLVHRQQESLVAAYEILLNNMAIARQIREQDLSQLVVSMELGRAEGMMLLEENLATMVKSGIIRLEDALLAANASQRLQRFLEQ